MLISDSNKYITTKIRITLVVIIKNYRPYMCSIMCSLDAISLSYVNKPLCILTEKAFKEG